MVNKALQTYTKHFLAKCEWNIFLKHGSELNFFHSTCIFSFCRLKYKRKDFCDGLFRLFSQSVFLHGLINKALKNVLLPLKIPSTFFS